MFQAFVDELEKIGVAVEGARLWGGDAAKRLKNIQQRRASPPKPQKLNLPAPPKPTPPPKSAPAPTAPATPAATTPAAPKGVLSRMWQHPYAEASRGYLGEAAGQAAVNVMQQRLAEKMQERRAAAARRGTIYMT